MSTCECKWDYLYMLCLVCESFRSTYDPFISSLDFTILCAYWIIIITLFYVLIFCLVLQLLSALHFCYTVSYPFEINMDAPSVLLCCVIVHYHTLMPCIIVSQSSLCSFLDSQLAIKRICLGLYCIFTLYWQGECTHFDDCF